MAAVDDEFDVPFEQELTDTRQSYKRLKTKELSFSRLGRRGDFSDVGDTFEKPPGSVKRGRRKRSYTTVAK
jgi:hypothetical protein